MDVRKLQNAIRYKVLQSQAVRDLINTRFYPAELATIANPTYPCANFKLLHGFNVGHAKENLSGRMQIWAWSKANYDEASEILAALEDCLANSRVENFEMYAVLNITLTPQQLYIEEARIYGYVMEFHVYANERS